MQKTVLITGASRGIGRAAALAFAKKGYRVIGLYNKSTAKAEGLKAEIASLGASVEMLAADVADYAAVEAAVRQAEGKLGRVDVLVANAGVSLVKQINDTTEAEWDRLFDVNAKGTFNAVKAVVQGMIDKKWGRIITVSSLWGEVGASCEVAYSASKAAVIGFTTALAKELAPSGITVNCVAPGVIDTDMNACFTGEERAALEADIPACRYGTPEEVAEAMLFLASEGSGYVTGQVLGVNGGFK